jgi:hypothetical protein
VHCLSLITASVFTSRSHNEHLPASEMPSVPVAVAVLLVGLVCVHTAHAAGPYQEVSLFDVTRRAFSGLATHASLSSSKSQDQDTALVSTCAGMP